VPDAIAFYPWMTVSQTLEFFASFREHWNRDLESDLLERFQLDPGHKAAQAMVAQRPRGQGGAKAVPQVRSDEGVVKPGFTPCAFGHFKRTMGSAISVPSRGRGLSEPRADGMIT